MADSQSFAAIVSKQLADSALGALREEGVYDDSRSIYECGDETIAIPVTDPPEQTDVIEVVREAGEPRLKTLDDHLRNRGWTEDEIAAAPGSWAVIGSVVLVRVEDCPRPDELGEALLALHGEADTVLARGGISGPHREPTVEVLAGEGDTETVHREHGIEYALDLDRVMFSPGNKDERVRMGEAVTADERVLDMFAGIGYFALPMASNGARVTAVERNPDAFQYLVENVVRNSVQDTVETYRADCRDVIEAGEDSAGTDHGARSGDGPRTNDGARSGDADPAESFEFDRIVMGYYDAHEYLDSALSVLAPGGIVHMHEATPDPLVPQRPIERLEAAVSAADREVEILDHRRVKGHSEGVDHVVIDARVR